MLTSRAILHWIKERLNLLFFNSGGISRVNLACGHQKIPGYFGIDFDGDVDLRLNLLNGCLPFKSYSLDSVICISAINYFSRDRGDEIIREVFRVLKPGGVARFAVQDLRELAIKYINRDLDFFFQKLPNGLDRFRGKTLGDKFVAWFYGYPAKWEPCKYFYDYDSLAAIFKDAGFSTIENRKYLDSRLAHIELIDNRPEQMFFLEAVK